MSHTSTCTSSALPVLLPPPFSPLSDSPALQTCVLLASPHPPPAFPPSPTTIAFPSAPSPLPRLIVCVLTGPCHSGADLWAARILPRQGMTLSSRNTTVNTHTHTHTRSESGAHLQAPPARTCRSSPDFIYTKITHTLHAAFMLRLILGSKGKNFQNKSQQTEEFRCTFIQYDCVRA